MTNPQLPKGLIKRFEKIWYNTPTGKLKLLGHCMVDREDPAPEILTFLAAELARKDEEIKARVRSEIEEIRINVAGRERIYKLNDKEGHQRWFDKGQNETVERALSIPSLKEE